MPDDGWVDVGGSNFVGWLEIDILRCTSLQAKDRNLAMQKTTSDPYVKVSMGSQPPVYTSTILRNLQPTWNERLFVLLHTDWLDQPIELKVYDWDKGNSDDFLGEHIFTLAQVSSEEENTKEQVALLHDPKHPKTKCGTINFRVRPVRIDEMQNNNNLEKFLQFKAYRDIHIARGPGFWEVLRRRLLSGKETKRSDWSKVNRIEGKSPFATHHECNTCGKRKKGVCVVCGCLVCDKTNCAPAWCWIGPVDDTTAILPLTKERDKMFSSSYLVCNTCDGYIQQFDITNTKEPKSDCLLLCERIVQELDMPFEQVKLRAQACEIFADEILENVQPKALERLKGLLAEVREAELDTAKRAKIICKKLETVIISKRAEAVMRANVMKSVNADINDIQLALGRCRTKVGWIETLLATEEEVGHKASRARDRHLCKGVLLVTIKTGSSLGKNAEVSIDSPRRMFHYTAKTDKPGESEVHNFEAQVAVAISSPAGDLITITVNSKQIQATKHLRLYPPRYESNSDANSPKPIFESRGDMEATKSCSYSFEYKDKSMAGTLQVDFQYIRVPPLPSYLLDQLDAEKLEQYNKEYVGPWNEPVKPGPGVLFVCAHSAKGVAIQDRDNTSDPYCVAYLKKKTGDEKKVVDEKLYQTRTAENTIDPKWNDDVDIMYNQDMVWCFHDVVEDVSDAILKFSFINKNGKTLDATLGKVKVDIDPSKSINRIEEFLNGQPGKVFFSACFFPIPANTALFRMHKRVDTSNLLSGNIKMISKKLQQNVQAAVSNPIGAIKTTARVAGGMTKSLMHYMGKIIYGENGDENEEMEEDHNVVTGESGTLVMKIHRAKEIKPSNDLRGKATRGLRGLDPYAKVIVGGKTVFKTKVAQNTNDPSWEAVVPDITITDSLKQKVEIEVKCKSIIGVHFNEVIGRTQILYDSKHRKLSEDEYLPIGEQSAGLGKISLTVSFNV
eukprot:m.102995 g.102995  ORF g.102995 m.102995 type:complete len:957 (+) comp13792_c0_seq1:328-3198(+)